MHNSTKSRKSEMSGPAKTCPGGQVLTANQRKYFYFFRNYTEQQKTTTLKQKENIANENIGQ